jgi:hypothetical protein
MALDAEFKKYLHELMVEVALRLQDEEAHYKNALVYKAIQTHNGGAMPIAYKDAQLHAIENRVGKTIEKYLEAVSIWGREITPAFERDMIKEFIMLTAGPNSIHFPPAIKGHQVQAVQGAFARERAQLTNRLVREGTNRLRELKMKMKTTQKPSQSTVIQGDQFNNYGIAGSIGPHSTGTIHYQQQWTAIQNQVDLNALAGELEELRKHLHRSASSSSDYQHLALLSEAEEQAKKHDGGKAMEVLSKIGKSALGVAKDIGTEIAAKALAKSMGLEP